MGRSKKLNQAESACEGIKNKISLQVAVVAVKRYRAPCSGGATYPPPSAGLILFPPRGIHGCICHSVERNPADEGGGVFEYCPSALCRLDGIVFRWSIAPLQTILEEKPSSGVEQSDKPAPTEPLSMKEPQI